MLNSKKKSLKKSSFDTFENLLFCPVEPGVFFWAYVPTRAYAPASELRPLNGAIKKLEFLMSQINALKIQGSVFQFSGLRMKSTHVQKLKKKELSTPSNS
jgi:hypothetical protein